MVSTLWPARAATMPHSHLVTLWLFRTLPLNIRCLPNGGVTHRGQLTTTRGSVAVIMSNRGSFELSVAHRYSNEALSNTRGTCGLPPTWHISHAIFRESFYKYSVKSQASVSSTYQQKIYCIHPPLDITGSTQDCNNTVCVVIQTCLGHGP